jgi:hypothetical protein
MTLMAPNPEQNNNLKSVETQWRRVCFEQLVSAIKQYK